MQTCIIKLIELGPLPSSKNPDDLLLEKIQSLLSNIKKPITDDEARALVKLFGPDECFGLAWSLLHSIETAPGWPLSDVLNQDIIKDKNEWLDRLKTRAKNKDIR